MKELRPGSSGRSEIRILFASDLRGYLEAVGGSLSVEYVMGDRRVQVA